MKQTMELNTVNGIDPVGIRLTATFAPQLRVHGVSEVAAREVSVRVKSALAACGVPSGAEVHVEAPEKHRLPADAALDLPIALEVAALHGAVRLPANLSAYGELSMDGRLRHVRGMCCRLERNRGPVYVPEASAAEVAAFVESPGVAVAFLSLDEILARLRGDGGGRPVEPARPSVPDPEPIDYEFWSDACFDSITRTGRVLLVAPPGSGKILLGRNVARALPRLPERDALEVTRVHSVAGLVDERGPVVTRPFRAPHHTVSAAGLVGGGNRPRPGEVSLAHRGVLLLDELPEFAEPPLRLLAHCLSAREVTLASSTGATRFPAAPAAVVATANPCPCGWRGSPRRPCRCGVDALARYESRLAAVQERLELPRIDSLEIRGK